MTRGFPPRVVIVPRFYSNRGENLPKIESRSVPQEKWDRLDIRFRTGAAVCICEVLDALKSTIEGCDFLAGHPEILTAGDVGRNGEGCRIGYGYIVVQALLVSA